MKALVLAAGLSRRMQRQKLLLPFGNGTVLDAVLDAVAGAPFSERIVVVSARIRPHLEHAEGAGFRICVNLRPEAGLSGSLRLGLRMLAAGDDFCLMLGDQPLVDSAQIARHIRLFQERDQAFSALVPAREGAPGHPAFFAAVWRERLLRARGDVGGRNILRAHAGEILWVPGEDSFFADLDTPEDYARLEKR